MVPVLPSSLSVDGSDSESAKKSARSSPMERPSSTTGPRKMGSMSSALHLESAADSDDTLVVRFRSSDLDSVSWSAR